MNTETQDDSLKENIQNDDIVVAAKLEKSQTRGPGSRLRDAREAKQLTVEDIARKLFLTTAMVTQIEADDYRSTPALTFMKGYLRSYARSVNVDEEVVIKEFNGLNLRDKPASMPIQNIYKTDRHLARKSVPWFGTLVGIIIILVIVFWVHSEFSGNDVTATADNPALSVITTTTTTNSAATAGAVTAPLTPNVTVTNDATSANKVITKENDKKASDKLTPENHKAANDQRSKRASGAKVAQHKKTEQKHAQMSSPF